MAALLLLLVLAASLCCSELIDRIAATVGKNAIAESALRLEIRITALLNGEEPDFSPENRRKTLSRLIEQALIRREVEISRYAVEDSAAMNLLEKWKKERFASEQDYQKALEKHRVREEDLRLAFLKQLTTLRFIEARFRPGAQVSEAEMVEYYQKKLVPEWQNENRPPSFDAVRGRIEEILIDQRVDQLVDNWLKEARARTRIEIREEVFR